MAATDAAALELGEINVQSALGQPLRASVAFALRPNETVAEYCVSAVPNGHASGLPPIQSVRVAAGDGILRLTSRSPISEPMSSLRIVVNCPYTPHLAREYVVLVDPVGTQPVVAAPPREDRQPVRRPTETPATSPAVAIQPARRAAPAARATEAVATGERYRVQPGDTLSEIAQRIDNRSVSLWTAVNEIFNANPGAFLNDDQNLLKAGTCSRALRNSW